MPDAGIFEYLIGYFNDIGGWGYSGNDIIPMQWETIKAWQDVTGITLDIWEAQVLRDMSIAYVNMYHAAQESGYPCPCDFDDLIKDNEV